MRIAEFTDNYGPGRSGILYAVQQIEGTLLAQGHDVLVVAPKAEGPNPHRGHPNRAEVRLPSIKVWGVPARLATLRGSEKAMAEVVAWKPDVIHVHGLGPVGLLGVAMARRTGIPLLVTWHTDWQAYAAHYKPLAPLLGAFYEYYKIRAGADALDYDEAREAEVRNKAMGKALSGLMGACAAMLSEADLVTSPYLRGGERPPLPILEP